MNLSYFDSPGKLTNVTQLEAEVNTQAEPGAAHFALPRFRLLSV